jgi:hypothetical protein
MFRFVLSLLVAGASAFAPIGSAIAQSRLAAPAASAAPLVARASVTAMSAVTERDADGNPVVHFEMCASSLSLTPLFR